MSVCGRCSLSSPLRKLTSASSDVPETTLAPSLSGIISKDRWLGSGVSKAMP